MRGRWSTVRALDERVEYRGLASQADPVVSRSGLSVRACNGHVGDIDWYGFVTKGDRSAASSGSRSEARAATSRTSTCAASAEHEPHR